MTPAFTPDEPAAQLDYEQRAQRKASIVTVLVLALALAAAFLLWLTHRAEEADALREMPAEERRELFEGTRQTLLAACAPETRPAGLDEYCRVQATFLLKFEECDASCQELAERSRPQPTR